MNKPFNLQVIDTKQSLSKVINKSNLPITMITSIVRDLYNEVLLVENNIVEQEKRQYEESLNEEVKSL